MSDAIARSPLPDAMARGPLRRGVLVATALGLAAGVGACGDDDGADDDGPVALSDGAVVEYHYGDSSVPPEHHRSYTLTIRSDEVHVVVDSYGDVLQDTTAPVPADVWRRLSDGVADVADVEADDPDDGCDGGTSRSLTVTDGGDTVVDLEVGVCGGDGREAADQLDAYVQPVIDGIPGWEDLTA